MVELLVTVAIIGVLVGMILPAMSRAREASRRSACLNKLAQIGTALITHDADKAVLPGWRNQVETFTPQRLAAGDRQQAMVSWTVMILPFLGERELFSWYDTYTTGEPADVVADKRIAGYLCPAAGSLDGGPLSYMGNGGTGAETLNDADQWRGDGVFLDAAGNRPQDGWHVADPAGIYNPARGSLSQVADGAGCTLLVAERSRPTAAAAVAGWAANPRPAVADANAVVTTHLILHPPALDGQDPPAGSRTINPAADTAPLAASDWAYRFPSSAHPGGAAVVFCDGHASFIGERIEPWVYGQLLTSDHHARSERARQWERHPAAAGGGHYIFDERDIAAE